MSVDPATAKHRADYHGQTYYFCCNGCRTKFIADPQKYLAKSKAAPAPVVEGAIYTCPMHPQIRQDGPGACPICGMALEPEMPSADTGPNPELADMTRRFWIGLALAVPVMVDRDERAFRRALVRACRRPTGSSSPSPRRWCCGPAGRSSCAARSRWSRATSTCSR